MLGRDSGLIEWTGEFYLFRLLCVRHWARQCGACRSKILIIFLSPQLPPPSSSPFTLSSFHTTSLNIVFLFLFLFFQVIRILGKNNNSQCKSVFSAKHFFLLTSHSYCLKTITAISFLQIPQRTQAHICGCKHPPPHPRFSIQIGTNISIP